MSKCSAAGCTTNEGTKINGRNLTLFSFPTYDDSLFKQWEANSKLTKSSDQDKTELKLCQLHFGSSSFVTDEKNALAPGAVPTIFEFNNKRRINEEEKARDSPEEPPSKQRKSQAEDERQNNVTKPAQIPQSQLDKPKSVPNDEDNKKSGESMPPSITSELEDSPSKNIGGTSSVFEKQIDMGKKVYRLIIRIDKVIEKSDTPSAKEAKVVEKQEPEERKPTKTRSRLGAGLKNGGPRRPCSKTGCKLIKTTLNSKPVFQCERCNKYYVVKQSKSDVNNWTCYICQEVLSSPDALSFHIRKHFTCDMCQAQCSSQLSYDKHLRLHVSTDPLLPYKCHKCSETFEVKADVRQHWADKHTKISKEDRVSDKKQQSASQVLFRCKYCYAVFKNEEAYKSHVELHTGDGEFDCALCTKSFKTAKHLATHQARHLGAVKFTCKVCSKEFSSLDAVETHMKTHMEVVREEHKCNICKKIFKTESILNSHMRGHLSRAHRCPLCHKAFINKTTLRIHFKSHSKAPSEPPTSRDSIAAKKHTCTLCPSTFESRSRLYNHIMTHLEQMHGAEGGDVVLDGLDELFETDEDVRS